MSEYKKYPKIHRLGKEETDGILEETFIVQEKVDGANISIFWLDGEVRCGTRTRMLPNDGSESFNGFVGAVAGNPKIAAFLEANQDLILYGEWLVKHTITYPDEAYRKIYLFDIFSKTDGLWFAQESVKEVAETLDIEYPHIFATGKLTEEQIKEFVGKSHIAPAGEGVVLKAHGWKNKFGDHVYAKVVHQKFKESNAIVFGGNNKYSDTYWEMYVVNKYATVGRVQKIIQKIEPELDHRIDFIDTPRVAQTCYHDMITEEIWEIQGKVLALDFKKLRTLANKKFVQIFHDILNNTLSIADTNKDDKTETTST